MYANRFGEGPRFRPASLGAAVAINGGLIAALLLASPQFVPRILPKPPMTIIEIAPEPEPTVAPEPRAAQPQAQPTAVPLAPVREVEVLQPSPNEVLTGPVTGDPPGVPGGTGTTEVKSEPVVVPLFVAAREDPRYLTDFQPPYPDYERDAGREDVVRLRVLIGVDGRVKQVERIGGRDSFVRVATNHALAKWRFRPATRGGVPEESWRVMTVRFQLNN